MNDVEINQMYKAVLDSDLPESEKQYIIDMNMNIGQLSLMIKELRETITEIATLIKQRKTNFKAELNNSSAMQKLVKFTNELRGMENQFDVLCTKYITYGELLFNRINAGEYVPENVQKLLIG